MEEHDWQTLVKDGMPFTDDGLWWPPLTGWLGDIDTLSAQAHVSQVEYWAIVGLRIAFQEIEWVDGEGLDMWHPLRIDAGFRVRRLAELLGRGRVEAVVQDVERAFAECVGANRWRDFAEYILPESYEGRYPGRSSPFDSYREPHLSADKHHLLSHP